MIVDKNAYKDIVIPVPSDHFSLTCFSAVADKKRSKGKGER